LVDDEEGIRNVLGIALMDLGHPVYTAAGYEDALSLFRRETPGIVLTDIKMPGRDGIDLLKTIKQESPDTEVIMITGHGELDLAIKSLKSAASDFITKPIQDNALEIALRRAEEKIALKRQLRAYTEGLEQLVEEKSRELIVSERMTAIGQTVAGLSHSIKNIAGGLKGGAFVLEKGIELADMAYLNRGWEMVKGNVDRITRLSMDLLNYAKTIELNYQMCDPNQPVIDIVSLLQGQAADKDIQIRTTLIPDPKPLEFDPEGIHQCLMNLVVNGMDACDAVVDSRTEKSINIDVTDLADWGVAYRVCDNGCGMKEDTQKRLFQGFFTTKGTRGTGIGFMMTRNIIEKHRGDIDVKTVEGVGTTVTLKIPDPALIDLS